MTVRSTLQLASVVLGLLGGLLVGCTSGKLPSVASAPASIEYVVFDWALANTKGQDKEKDRGEATARRDRAKEELQRAWRAELLQAYGELLVDRGERDRVYVRTDNALRRALPTLRGELAAVRGRLARQVVVPVQPVECAQAVQWATDKASVKLKTEFSAWLTTHPEVTLAVLPALAPEELRRELDGLEQALATREALEEAVGRISAAADRSDAELAYRSLLAFADRRPELARLRELDDKDGNAAFQKRWVDAGAHALDLYLKTRDVAELAAISKETGQFDLAKGNLASAERLLKQSEEKLSADQAVWRANEVLNEILKRCEVPFRTFCRDLAEQRGLCWKQHLKGEAAKHRFWQAYEFCRDQLAEIKQFRLPHFAAYQYADSTTTTPAAPLCADAIARHLWEGYTQLLPAAATYYLEVGQKAVDNSLYGGISLGLCAMFDEMAALAKDQPLNPAGQKAIADLKHKQQAWQTAVREQHQRLLYVDKFTAGQPGLDETFVKDLRRGFQLSLEREPVALLGIPLANQERGAKDCLVADGNVANYTVQEMRPRTEPREIIRKGRVTFVPNPAYEERKRKGKSTEGLKQGVYRQEVVKHVINHQAFDKVADLRVTFQLRQDNAELPCEVKQSFRKTFVQENFNPANDKAVEVKESETELQEEPMPTLQNDQLMSDAQMLDWAREETLKLIVGQVLRFVQEGPLRLAAEAHQKASVKDHAASANAWGVCLELCRDVRPPTAGTPAAPATEPEPPYRADDQKRTRELQQRLANLKEKVWPETVKALLAYLDQQRPATP